MGFFSGVASIAGGLSGLMGGKQSSGGGSVMGGFYAMPKWQQDAYKGLTQFGVKALQNPDLFKPISETADETAAFNMIREGFAPDTAEELSTALAMYQNPYEDIVIKDINEQAAGDYSLLNQYLSGTGQFGSNRAFYNADMAEESRLNSIARARNDAYSNMLRYAMEVSPSWKQSQAEGLAGIGGFQRNLALQQALAPFAAAQTAQGLISSFPVGLFQGAANYSGGGAPKPNTFDKISGVASAVGSLAGLFSDRALKKDIVKIGAIKGLGVYKYAYKWGREAIGFMADEVEAVFPDAVKSLLGIKIVDYGRIL